jgi:hypothetical protein
MLRFYFLYTYVHFFLLIECSARFYFWRFYVHFLFFPTVTSIFDFGHSILPLFAFLAQPLLHIVCFENLLVFFHFSTQPFPRPPPIFYFRSGSSRFIRYFSENAEPNCVRCHDLGVWLPEMKDTNPAYLVFPWNRMYIQPPATTGNDRKSKFWPFE